MATKDDAKNLVNAFEARTRRDLWLHIQRADLAKGLKARIDDPDLINQGQSSLCGPSQVCTAPAPEMAES